MKKIILLAALMAGTLVNATVIVRDIPDFEFTPESTYSFDFNNDGTSEFTFDEQNGSISCMFQYGQVDFVGVGTLDSGYGWDKMKALAYNTLIGPQSSFDAQGDAYINAPWGNAEDMFPAGDSYIGVKFKLGTNVHYGWILVNSTGGAEGVITLKSYAYNDVANQSINAGQTTLGLNDATIAQIKMFPNPTQNVAYIQTEETIKGAILTNVKGEVLSTKVVNNSIDLTALASGVYFVTIETTSNQKSTYKLIKQ